MIKDKRYINAKNLILAGHVKTFRNIFDIIPKTVVARDLNIGNVRFSELIEKVGDFHVRHLSALADLLEIDEMEIFKIVSAQNKEGKRTKSPKK